MPDPGGQEREPQKSVETLQEWAGRDEAQSQQPGQSAGGGRIPAVKPLLPGTGTKPEDRKSASEKAYDWVTKPDEGDNKRSRGSLGPEEQGNYAQPYKSTVEALAAEAFLRSVLLPAVLVKFGPEVHGLWASYLSRNPGDSLEPRIFSGKSGVADAFRRCQQTQYESKRITSDVEGVLRSQWDTRVATLPIGQWVSIPFKDLIGERTLDTNFSNPHDIPGHIAGGVGSSDAGPDTRSVSGNVRLKRTAEDTVELEPDLQFVCFDAIDFIPGNIGTRMESTFTIPLSRLEASGWAYDVPFEVRYPGPVDHIVIKRGGQTQQETRFAEASRGEQARGNAGAIPDQQTPGAKSADQLKSEREADESKRKGKALGGGG
jgi:hypothetical protein